ncbi:MAG TPA: hypothetical protein VKP78_05950 [bacterium]|nr:hypothetical protein [bacterium]
MKKLVWTSWALILLIMIGCDTTTNFDGDKYPYPLSTGNQWEFRREFKSDYYPDSLNRDSIITTVAGSDSISILVASRETLKDSIETIKLLQKAWEDTLVNLGEYYYQERDTGLFQIAHRNYYHYFLPKPTNYSNPFNQPLMPEHLQRLIAEESGSLGKITANDELRFEENPPYTIKYPLKMGTSWYYRQSPWLIEKEVVADTNITVPAGSFDCYRVYSRYNIPESRAKVTINDYIADQGLILRELHSESMIYQNSFIDSALYNVWNDKYILMDYEVH